MTEKAPIPQLTIVTGGSRGIGAAIALRLARDGHRIVVGYSRDEDGASAVVADIRDAGGEAFAVQADVTTDDGIETLFAEAARLGVVTGLVNNAGATLHIAPLADTPAETVRRVIDLNFTAAVLCARRAVLEFTNTGTPGTIVTISSASATLGNPGEYIHYAAAKAGVEALTVSLAREVGGHGIRVAAVAPGLIRTGIHADAGDPGRLDRGPARIPLGRVGEPDDIAPAVAWLFSPEAAYVSGAVLRVSGGL